MAKSIRRGVAASSPVETIHTDDSGPGLRFHVEGGGNAIEVVRADANGQQTVAMLEGPTRPDNVIVGRGLKGEAFNIAGATSSTALAAGTRRASAVGFKKGDVVTNLVLPISVAASGTAPTHFWIALYKSDGASVAITADLAADAGLTSTGLKAYPLTTPYTIPSDGLYYVVVLMVGSFSVTQPSLGGAAIVAANLVLGLGSGVMVTGTQAAQTEVTSALTLTATGGFLWAGWN